ncbi:MAG: beta-aspartyl-peptidase [Planctomycetota bacterium]|jgi:beta-aspartyl-dipeptidase (metallo-type)|nr:beta-aspartyl-peptidase [Planctomycetota bacterium]
MLTILKHAQLYTPRFVGTKTLVIGGERVLWIGSENLSVPSELVNEVLDLEGACVLPGLVDLHAHPTGGGGESGPASRVPAPSLSSYTRAGVTSVVGLLGTDAETRSMESLLARIRALREEGISAWCYTGGYHLPGRTLTGSLRGDIVHLQEVIGIGELALSDFRSSQLTLAELLRVASQAQVGGMITGKAGICHLHMGDSERGLDLVRAALDTGDVPARVFHPTHVNRRVALFEEALDLTTRGCSIDITAFPVEEGDEGLSAQIALERYLDEGYPAQRVTLSSDSGGCLPVFDSEAEIVHMDVGRSSDLTQTLTRLFLSGRSPQQFLPAFTSNPAQLAKLPRKGVLGPGSDADLVVLDGDYRVRDVMARGCWHVRDAQSVILGTFETAQSTGLSAHEKIESYSS